MAKKQESKPQLDKRVKKEIEEQKAQELVEKKARQKARDEKVHQVTGKERDDQILLAYNQGIREGKLELLEQQLKEKDEAEAKPVTIADQLKELEGKIKYQRLEEEKKIKDRRLISLINSMAHELGMTLRSLLDLERRGMIIHISRTAYEKALKKEGRPSRINSTARKNLNIIAWSVEQLKVCMALLGTGDNTQELPLELYPVNKNTHNQELKKYFKLAERRKRKAEAILKKQQIKQD